jgi:hypothetical protein
MQCRTVIASLLTIMHCARPERFDVSRETVSATEWKFATLWIYSARE